MPWGLSPPSPQTLPAGMEIAGLLSAAGCALEAKESGSRGGCREPPAPQAAPSPGCCSTLGCSSPIFPLLLLPTNPNPASPPRPSPPARGCGAWSLCCPSCVSRLSWVPAPCPGLGGAGKRLLPGNISLWSCAGARWVSRARIDGFGASSLWASPAGLAGELGFPWMSSESGVPTSLGARLAVCSEPRNALGWRDLKLSSGSNTSHHPRWLRARSGALPGSAAGKGSRPGITQGARKREFGFPRASVSLPPGWSRAMNPSRSGLKPSSAGPRCSHPQQSRCQTPQRCLEVPKAACEVLPGWDLGISCAASPAFSCWRGTGSARAGFSTRAGPSLCSHSHSRASPGRSLSLDLKPGTISASYPGKLCPEGISPRKRCLCVRGMWLWDKKGETKRGQHPREQFLVLGKCSELQGAWGQSWNCVLVPDLSPCPRSFADPWLWALTG